MLRFGAMMPSSHVLTLNLKAVGIMHGWVFLTYDIYILANVSFVANEAFKW